MARQAVSAPMLATKLKKDQAITTFGLIVTFAAAAGAHTQGIASFDDYQS
jgi:hypothetical protein